MLAEQVSLTWFGTNTPQASKGKQKDLATLSPWFGDSFAYTGTNMASPLREDIMRADKGAPAMMPSKCTADLHRQRKSQWTKDELEDAQAKRHSYHRRVANPVRRFKNKAKKKRGMRKSVIHEKVKAFQTAERLAFQKVGESPKELLCSHTLY